MGIGISRFTKYDKNGKLTSSYVNKDWETGYYDYPIHSNLRWKSFAINDSTLMVYGGHTQKDSIGVMGFLILDGKGKIKGVKDELDILKLKNQGKISYDVIDVTYYKNRFYIFYKVSLLNNVAADIRQVLVCNSNFDSLTSYSYNSYYAGFYNYWPKQNQLKMIAPKDDSLSNIKIGDQNKKICFLDTFGKEEKCFKLIDILGREYFISNTSQKADYNVFSLHHRLATYDGGLLLIYTREYPYYDSDIGGYLSNREEILVKISPGDGLDTIGHEADDTNVIVPVKPEKDVIMFPNPNNTNTLSINTDTWQSITVYNAIGQVIKTYVNPLTASSVVDISSLSSGNYFLKIILKDKTIYKRLVKY